MNHENPQFLKVAAAYLEIHTPPLVTRRCVQLSAPEFTDQLMAAAQITEGASPGTAEAVRTSASAATDIEIPEFLLKPACDRCGLTCEPSQLTASFTDGRKVMRCAECRDFLASEGYDDVPRREWFGGAGEADEKEMI